MDNEVVKGMQTQVTHDAQQPDTADVDQLQRRSGQPWSRRWNWLLDKPTRSGVGMRSLVAVALLFNAVLSVLRLSPVWGPQTDAFGLVINVSGVILLPVGLLFAWSALRLHRFRTRQQAPGAQS